MVKRKRSVEVDWTQSENLESGGGSVLAAPGWYVLAVEKADVRKTKAGDSENVVLSCRIVDGSDQVGGRIIHNCSLKPTAMWKLWATLKAMGKNPKSSKVQKVNLDKLEGEEFGCFLEEDTYEGKTRSQVGETCTVEEARERIEKVDSAKGKKSEKKASKKSTKAKKDDDEEEEEEEDEEEESNDEESDDEDIDVPDEDDEEL